MCFLKKQGNNKSIRKKLSNDAYINESGIISLLDVVQDWSFVETCQLCHVLHFVEFRGIHLLQIIFGNMASFTSLHDLYFHFITSLSLDRGWDEAKVFVWDPDEPLLGLFCLSGGIIEGIVVHFFGRLFLVVSVSINVMIELWWIEFFIIYFREKFDEFFPLFPSASLWIKH